MKEFSVFSPYFAFGADCPPDERERWRRSFVLFLKKVTLKNGYKPLIIKSPVHTARIPILLDIFPKARFVYAHRNPYQVFQSSANMANTYYPFCYLNR